MTALRILASIATSNPSLLAQVWALRYEVLRKPLGMTYLSASFTEDELETTIHLVALSEDLPIGCVSLLIDRDKPSIQLRGMAVLTQQQGTGVGAKLLSEAYVIATKHEKSLWCNARQSAIKFYEKNGWTAYGPFFEIPIIGEHVAMQWKPVDYKRQRS